MSLGKLIISVLGGFQFGYTIAIMAGALLFLIPLHELDLVQQGFVTSSVLIGACVGSIAGGVLAEHLGRKKTQQLIAAFFFIGSCVTSCSGSLLVMVIGRLIQGVAMGSIAVVGPLYIAEISPPELRGRQVAAYQLAVTLGILCAYSVSYGFSQIGAWRWMFGLGIIPAVVQGLGFSILPDVPPVSNPISSWKSLFQPRYRLTLLSALLVNAFQQLTGINAVIYFAPSIFELLGLTSPSQAIFSAILIGGVNFLSTFISLFFIDTKGRKPLLLIGLAGMAFSLVTLAISWWLDGSSVRWLATGSLMIFVGCFAFSLGPITQLITSELFPRAIRSTGVACSILLNLIFNFLIVFTFMDLSHLISPSGTFLLYAVIGIVAFFYVWKAIPETKGTSLQ